CGNVQARLLGVLLVVGADEIQPRAVVDRRQQLHRVERARGEPGEVYGLFVPAVRIRGKEISRPRVLRRQVVYLVADLQARARRSGRVVAESDESHGPSRVLSQFWSSPKCMCTEGLGTPSRATCTSTRAPHEPQHR